MQTTINNVANLIIIDNSDQNSEISFSQFKDHILQCKTILEDCIKSKPENQTIKDIKITLSNKTFSSDVLGEAYTDQGIININQKNTGSYELNKTIYHQNISVILHEMIHIFGIFPHNIVNNPLFTIVTDDEGNSRRAYIGSNGLNGYKKILLANNIVVPDPLYLLIEDDFDAGTKHVHLEEAANESNGELINEVISINNQFYPSLHNEIMTGLLNQYSSNFITPITIGCLEDLGYTVNYNSEYILYNNNDFRFIVGSREETLGSSYNYLNLNTTNRYHIKYLNDILGHPDLKNRDLLIKEIKEDWGDVV